MTLHEFNALAFDDAVRLLRECCGSNEWATLMAHSKPFATLGDVLEDADRIWLRLGEPDWLEAFAAHPRIGEPSTVPASQREQADVYAATGGIRQALAEGNAEYEKRFGFIYIVFASGKSPDELLSLLQMRLGNSRQVELKNAAAEQMKITRLRLERLFGS